MRDVRREAGEPAGRGGAVLQREDGLREIAPDAGGDLRLIAVGAQGAQRDLIGQRPRAGMVAHRRHRQQMVQRGENQRRVFAAPRGDGVQLVPARADIDPLLLQPPEQRDGVGDVAEVVGLHRAHFRVIDAEGEIVPPLREVEEREMPAHVEGEIIALFPHRPGLFEPCHARRRAAVHLEHMRHRVHAPAVARLVAQRRAPGALGLREFARLLEAEGVAAEHETVAGHRLRPFVDDHARRRQHARLVARHEAQRVREFDREEVIGAVDEMLVEPLRRLQQITARRRAERADERPLAGGSAPPHESGARGGQTRLRAGLRLRARQKNRSEPLQRVGARHIGVGGKRAGDRFARAGAVRGEIEHRVLERAHRRGAVGLMLA